MELVVNPHPLLGASLHHHPHPGTMLYPTKDSVWQPVVTSLPSLTEVPKESIIANTDFTTTSLIAKRRLSSKKRKKFEGQQQNSGNSGKEGGSSEGNPSPMDSPAVTSTTYTPPAYEKSNPMQKDNFHGESKSNLNTSIAVAMDTSQCSHTSEGVPHLIHQHTHTHTHHIAPITTATGNIQLRPVPAGQYLPMVATAAGGNSYPTITPAVGVMAKQFTDPVLNQLQQELNYRFLQEQSGLLVNPGAAITTPFSRPVSHSVEHSGSSSQSSQAAQQQHMAGEDRPPDLKRPPGFKWCYAHVTIAKQIQQHQQQSKAMAAATVAVTHSVLQSKEAGSRQHLNGHHPPLTDAVAVQHQLALLQQAYGLPPNAALPGYMTVPYSMQEVQLRMQSSFVHPGAAVMNSVGAPLVKPVVAAAPSQITLGKMESDVNPNSVHMMNGVHLQAPLAHSLPMAAVAPSDLNNAVLQGAPLPTAGSWVVPAVPVMGSCIINPFQPGIMATSWVK